MESAWREAGDPDARFLVICPASAVPVWTRELKQAEDAGRWTVQSYDRARVHGKPGWFAVVLDEAHYLKTRNAARTQKILGDRCDAKGGVIDGAHVVFALTGTPTPNNPGELWSLCRALFPSMLRPAHDAKAPPTNYWQFVSRFCTTQDTGFGIKITGGKNLELLRSRLEPHVLRRRKEDVLKDLPPITFGTLPLAAKAPPETAVSKEIIAALDKHGLAGLRALGPHIATWRHNCGVAKIAAVLAWLEDWRLGGGGKIVVFAHHREVIEALCKGQEPGSFARLDGASSPKQRAEAVQRFQNDPACLFFFGQIQAAGTAITLTAADTALFVESSWTPSDNEQAAMRIHRIGQRRACSVLLAFIPGGVDERITLACQNKMKSISALWN